MVAPAEAPTYTITLTKQELRLIRDDVWCMRKLDDNIDDFRSVARHDALLKKLRAAVPDRPRKERKRK